MDELKQFEKINQPISDKARRIIFAVIILVIIVGYFLYRIFVSFTDYEVSSTLEREDADQTEYVDFWENLLAYSRDGAFYTDYNGNLIWNETYEMSNPQIEICNNKLLVYDKTGTKGLVQSVTGNIGTITTTLPIVDGDISADGHVAFLMQEGSTGYLSLYNSDGDVIASGELHIQNSGYPMSIALSSDGEKMMVSLLNLTDGDVKTTILFYDFGSAGEDKENNIVGTFSYSNLVVPEVDFVENDEAIAFGDTEVIIFGNNKEPKVKKELFVSDEMKSVFHNDKYFGIVTTTEEGDTKLALYNMSATRRFETDVEEAYIKISLTKTNEVLLTDGENVTIYTLLGIKKFTYDFTGGIYQMIPWESYRTYILIEKGQIERIRLK